MRRRWSDLVLFGLLGVAAFFALVWMGVSWLAIAGHLLGVSNLAFDRQPAWLKGLHRALDFVPWILCGGVVVFAARRRRWMAIIGFVGAQILGWAVVMALLIYGPVVADYSTRVPFDATAWQAENRRDAQGTRVHMVDDLMRKHHLVGMRRESVDDLLGVPWRPDHFREYDYVYWLGPERGLFSIDSEWLVLKLKDDVVVEARVLTD